MIKNIGKCCKMVVFAAPIYVLLNLFILMAVSLAQVGSGYAMGVVTEAILESGGVFSREVWLPVLFFAVMITIGGNPENFKNMMVALYTNKARKIFSKIFMLRAFEEKQDSYYDSKYLDEYMFVRNNIESTTRVTATLFNKLAGVVITIFMTGFAIIRISPVILVFILLQAVLILIINNQIVKKKMVLNRKYVSAERKTEYYKDILSAKKHAKEIRILNLQDFFLKKWGKVFLDFSEAKYRFEIKAKLVAAVPSLVRQICLAGLTIYYLFLVSQKVMSVSDFVFVNAVMWIMVGNINSFVYLLGHDLQEDMLYVDRYLNFIGDYEEYLGRMRETDSCKEKAVPESEFEEMELRDIYYAYPNQENTALRGVNLKLHSGEIVCLLGYNGSGKSTLSKIMCGVLRDYKGEVILNGKDIKTLDQEQYYKHFGVGFQDFTRFSVSLYENVGVGCIEKLEEGREVEKALKKGNLTDLAAGLTNGEMTLLGKEYDAAGQELSGGQWQRIALARAYMGEPWLIVLDEPTASIDPMEELRLLQNFKEIIGNRAALLVSHRIGFARLADRIYLMQDGQILEEGSHEELIQKRGMYFDMFMTQKDLYEEAVV